MSESVRHRGEPSVPHRGEQPSRHRGEHRAARDGKLTTVEFSLADGRLCDVRVVGDFFLSPPTLWDRLHAALAECSAADSEADVEARVRAALPANGELLGFSAAAVAKAVRAALGDAEPASAEAASAPRPSVDTAARRARDWPSLGWELIPELPRSAELNVALDEVLLLRAVAGRRPPTLRFWGWSESAVVLGRFQSVRNEVDAAAAARLGVRLVRRMTGGGAMFLQPSGAITYSLVAPDRLAGGLTLRESYELFDGWVIEILRELGIACRHQPINDIAGPDGKIGGAAQARRNGWVLHHTTLAYEMDAAEMLAVLRLGQERLSDKGIASAGKRVGPLARQTARPRAEIAAALAAGFAARFGATPGSVLPDEEADAAELVASKYGSAAWTEELP